MNRPLMVASLVLALALPAYGAHAGGSRSTHVVAHHRSAPARSHATTPKRSRTSGTGHVAPHSWGCKTCPRDTHGRINRDPKARQVFLRKTGYPHGRPGYVVDHIVPLECGGSDTPSNMQWQTRAAAKAKDKTEGRCRK